MAEEKIDRAEINGITEADWQHWRNSPATKALRKFLTDYGDQLTADHVERWLGGADDAAAENEARGRIAAVREMEDLSFKDMQDFYFGPEQKAETP